MGILIYCAFYVVVVGMLMKIKTANLMNFEVSVALKAKPHQDDAILESDTISIDSSFGLFSLFDHEVPFDANCKDIMSRDKSVVLVIAYCNHPLDWMTEFLNGFEKLIDDVWIFPKCNMDVVGAPNGSKIFRLPNVGGCDHTIAHALQMYSGLPRNSENDMLVFLKDTFEISTNTLESQTFGDFLCEVEFYGLGCLPQHRTTLKVPLFHELHVLRTFTRTGHNRLGGSDVNENGTEIPFANENINSLGEWLDNLSLPIHPTKNITMVCYGGNFATTRKSIMKKPMWVWKAIERSLSRGNNIVEGHFAERAWASLLAKPLSNVTASMIWENQPDLINNPDFLRGRIVLKNGTFRKYPVE